MPTTRLQTAQLGGTEILPFAEREGVGVIVHSPVGSGILTGGRTHDRVEHLPHNDWRQPDERLQDPALPNNLAFVDRLTAVAHSCDTAPGTVAIAWALRRPVVDGAIVGFRRPGQVDPLIAAANLELLEDDITTITGDR